MKSENNCNEKKLKELSEEELEQVNGGTNTARCPDGRMTGSIDKCIGDEEKPTEEELKGALVGVKETNINVTVGMNKCSVTVCNEMNIPTCLQAYFGTYEAKLEKNRRSGEETIRNIRKVLKITEKIQEQSKEQSEESVKELPE